MFVYVLTAFLAAQAATDSAGGPATAVDDAEINCAQLGTCADNSECMESNDDAIAALNEDLDTMVISINVIQDSNRLRDDRIQKLEAESKWQSTKLNMAVAGFFAGFLGIALGFCLGLTRRRKGEP